MKLKRLTVEKTNGSIELVKKNIDLDMLSPTIAKILYEAMEQLAMLEKKAVADELIEIPVPLGKKMNLLIDGRQIIVEITGYEITKKDMNIILETKDGVVLKVAIKEALSNLKKIGSVNVS